MTQSVLILDGGRDFAHSKGRLNHALADLAAETLQDMGFQPVITRIGTDYDLEREVERILQAAALIWQAPAWWMGVPWTVKKYMDEVFTAGHGKVYANDGRTRSDPSKHYGSGGLLQGKHYMLSVTWNAPVQAFTDPADFFEGKGVDGVYFPFHKANQFLGLAPLPTFMANDVMKDPHIENDFTRYRSHLNAAFQPLLKC
ncbi:NAD(P)H-dependent oxidoreductase [Formicincola oecophyllae]|uniref:NAD(P)H-dependent oxidoreductase n=1 Tax=Formicincola oecophyllae TaxID=2558361 RepID=A0A4Y6U9V9_9PROT|nr:NAD(P)H-dependent oxidoreductase [Formicincola oecophyllae]QDH13358.1 NAD(P)H-dependent oxidoreductase [Formicincola oecophyllae]